MRHVLMFITEHEQGRFYPVSRFSSRFQRAQEREVFPMKLDRTDLEGWGMLALIFILTIALLPPIGIILWSWLGLLFLMMWSLEKTGVMIEKRK